MYSVQHNISPSCTLSNSFILIPERIREKFRICRICTSQIQGCQVYVETLMEYGVHRVSCTPSTDSFVLNGIPYRHRPAVRIYNAKNLTIFAWFVRYTVPWAIRQILPYWFCERKNNICWWSHVFIGCTVLFGQFDRKYHSVETRKMMWTCWVLEH
jgi:hypothetical protein